MEGALKEKPRPGGQRRLDGKQEAMLVALACSTPPDGRTSWTMQLLADRLVVMQVVESVSDETVRRTLKKRYEAVVERAMVYSEGWCRVRLASGRCAGLVCRTIGPATPSGVL